MILNGELYSRVPRILICAYNNRKDIVQVILSASEIDLKTYWGVRTIRKDRISQWIELVYETSTIGGIKKILEEIVKKAKKELEIVEKENNELLYT